MSNECRYSEWDKEGFVIPDEFILDENSDLADALRVFFHVGGHDFFKVTDPEYYAERWLAFVGGLYAQITDGKFPDSGRPYKLPITDEQRQSLIKQGVPDIFTSDREQGESRCTITLQNG